MGDGEKGIGMGDGGKGIGMGNKIYVREEDV